MTKEKYIKTHKLADRTYEMLIYLKIINSEEFELLFKEFFEENLYKIDYVETLAKYFEEQKIKNKGNIELVCNLTDLINDLNYLKQLFPQPLQ